MGTMQNQSSPTGAAANSRVAEGVGSPLSNEAYDVLTALQAKLEGLDAYRKYAQNGNTALWQELTRADMACVERLAGELERLVRDGKFRVSDPNRANA